MGALGSGKLRAEAPTFALQGPRLPALRRGFCAETGELEEKIALDGIAGWKHVSVGQKHCKAVQEEENRCNACNKLIYRYIDHLV